MPPSTFGFEPGRCRAEVAAGPECETEADCETEPECEGSPLSREAHGSMVSLFALREAKPACVSATYDLLPRATRDYIHFFL